MDWDTFFSNTLTDHLSKPFSLGQFCDTFGIKKTNEHVAIAFDYLLKRNFIVVKNSTMLEKTIFSGYPDINLELIPKRFFLEKKSFVIQPTDFEIKNNILIPGSRFQWFLDIDNQDKYLMFFFDNNECHQYFFSLPLGQIISYYFLMNENEALTEIINQHFDNINQVNNFSMDTPFKILVLDMKKIYTQLDVCPGDKIIFQFRHQSEYQIDIKKQKYKTIDEKKNTIIQTLFDEKIVELTHKLQRYANPTCVLLHLFYQEYRNLFGKYQLSIEELIKNSSTISCISYGFNSILWPTDTPLPITSKWNIILNDDADDEYTLFFKYKLHLPLSIEIIDFIIEKFFADDFSQNNFSSSQLISTIIKKLNLDSGISIYDIERLKKIIDSRKKNIEASYNPFKEKPETRKLKNIVISFFLDIVGCVNNLIQQNFIPSSFNNQTGIMLNQLLARSIILMKFYATYPNTINYAHEFYNTISDMNDVFNSIRTSIEIQIKNIK